MNLILIKIYNVYSHDAKKERNYCSFSIVEDEEMEDGGEGETAEGDTAEEGEGEEEEDGGEGEEGETAEEGDTAEESQEETEGGEKKEVMLRHCT